MDIGRKQLNLLAKAKDYLSKEMLIANSDDLNVKFYLNSWDPQSLGNAYLHLLISRKTKDLIQFFVKYLRNIVSIRHYAELELVCNQRESFTREIDTMIVSWCKGSDFDEKGKYVDRYFGCNSDEDSRVYWLLISIDGKLPNVLASNIGIYRKVLHNPLKGLLLSFLEIVKEINWVKIKGRAKTSISADAFFARQIAKAVQDLNKKFSFRFIIQPYEAQPFQHGINRMIKKVNPNAKTIGYLHSALPPLPTDLIYRKGAPDLLWVHGKGQLSILNKRLDWPLDSLSFIPSFRYRKQINDSFSGWIFLPYNFNNVDLIVDCLAKYLHSIENQYLPILKVRCHPAKLQSTKHQKLIREIEHLIEKFSSRFDASCEKQVSIILGSTAAIIEALERNVSVIHITEDPLFESHQNEIWEDIEVEEINPNVYVYSLRNKDNLITLGTDDLRIHQMLV